MFAFPSSSFLARTGAGIAALSSLCFSPPVQAVPVVAGAAATPVSGTTVAARPELAGVVLVDRVRPFRIVAPSGAVLHGTFQDRVVKRNGSGLLEFSYRIKNATDSKGSIILVRRQSFAPAPSVDVDYRLDGLGTVGAQHVKMTGVGGVVEFHFPTTAIKPGQESRFHFVGTKATEYDESGFATIQSDANVRTGFAVFAPKPATKGPNLKAQLFGPSTAKRGEDISSKLRIRVQNDGTSLAAGTNSAGDNGFMIDLMLSRDATVPSNFAVYSPNYGEDVLLAGGRVSNTQDLAPGSGDSYSVGATIPANTPPGSYFLAIRVDPGNKITESNESDNTFFLPIRVF